MKIRKAVIPAAGLGTRFLPITKTLAKEMLPIIDTPNLQYIAEEAKKSGIEELIVIVNKRKPEITDYFSRNKELENKFLSLGKSNAAETIKNVASLIKITIVYQEQQLGLGNAVLCAKEAIGNEDFALILGDDLIYNENSPAIGQLIEVYNQTNSSVLGIQEVPHELTRKYGIIDIKENLNNETFIVKNLIEKPDIDKAPSNFACVGRYILKNEIFKELETIKPGKGGEYQLTDALIQLLNTQQIVAHKFKGQRYDLGNKVDYVKAVIDFALRREDLHDKIYDFIKNIK